MLVGHLPSSLVNELLQVLEPVVNFILFALTDPVLLEDESSVFWELLESVEEQIGFVVELGLVQVAVHLLLRLDTSVVL